MSSFFAKNFQYSESMCPCGCGKDRPIEPELTYLLQALRDRIGNPIYITSGGGIRCKKYNKHVGGYVNSPHLTGKAVDIYSNAVSIIGLAKKAKYIGFNRIGLYPHNHFIHVDIVDPCPSESWLRDVHGNYKYFKTLEEAISFMEKTDEKETLT